MSNMSYCMFENTYKDLDDCYEKLGNMSIGDKLLPSEEKYKERLLELCKDIALDFTDVADED